MNLYTFFRDGTFYPIELESDEAAKANAVINPGTVKVVREFPLPRTVVWRANATKCQQTGCPHDAAAALALNFPATGMPVAEYEPFRIVLRLRLCAMHLEYATAADFLSEQLKEIVLLSLRGKVPPDFDRAFVSRCEFDSDEWRLLNRSRN